MDNLTLIDTEGDVTEVYFEESSVLFEVVDPDRRNDPRGYIIVDLGYDAIVQLHEKLGEWLSS